MRTMRLIIIFFSAFLLMNCSAKEDYESKVSSPGHVEIIKRYITAIGGHDTISNFKTRLIKGRLIDNRPYMGEPSEMLFRVYADSQGNWRFSSPTENYGYDQAGGWRQDSTGVVADPGQNRAKLGYVFDPASPLKMDRYFKKLRYGAKMTMNYRDVTAVYTDRDSTYYALWFDDESGLLNQIGYHWNLKDYREVDGVLIPFVVEQGRKGGSITLYFESVEHNIERLPEDIKRPLVK